MTHADVVDTEAAIHNARARKKNGDCIFLSHKVEHDEEEDQIAEQVVGERALFCAILELVVGVDLHAQRN